MQIAMDAREAGLTPLEYLCSIFRDEAQPPAVRLDAAKAACPYLHPRLNAIEARVDQKVTLVSPEEQEARRLAAIEAINEAFREVELEAAAEAITPVAPADPLSSSLHDDAPGEAPAPTAAPTPEAADWLAPRVRDFARSSPLQVNPKVDRLPVVARYRPPRPAGSSWSS